MHIIVVGCGRVGSELAVTLEAAGHRIAVIDKRTAAFGRLPESFGGQTVAGYGFDRDTLAVAGVERADALAAVTNGDNSNIVTARVARESFGIERVVARIYDPKRAIVYERLGIPTVASVAWTSARVQRSILPHGAELEWTDPTSSFVLVERRVRGKGAGQSVADVESHGARVCLLSRAGHAQVPPSALLLQEDDVIQVMVAAPSVDALDALLTGQVEGAHR